MTTIPASQLVNVTPEVLSAGGAQLELVGFCLTTNYRVPIGTYQSFAPGGSSNPNQYVAAYFGQASHQANLATVYFNGYSTRTQSPAAMLFAQFPAAAVPAYLQSGNVNGLGLAAIQALSGSLTVVMDGYTHTASAINLSGATSYSAAAALIQTGLNATLPTECSFTGSIAAENCSFTGFISGNVLTVTGNVTGFIAPGTFITGAASGTQITNQLSGTTGGDGMYAVNIAQALLSTSLTGSYGLLTAGTPSSGTLSIGQEIVGASVTAGMQIWALGTGQGLAGTYYVSPSDTVASENMTTQAAPVTVSYDSVSGSFFIFSGITGVASTSAFATGTLATPLLLTSASGAILSQGSPAQTPATFMTNLTNETQNWATFFLDFDPDYGNGNAQKLLFSAWVNSSDDAYAFVCWDNDITPTESANATNSMGQILKTNNSSGTILIYTPADLYHASFVSGMIASINTNATNGRITLMGKGQAGLVAGVTNGQIAQNLLANGYSYYGAYATRAGNFILYNNGGVTGPYQWADSYVNNIWLNAGFQQNGMTLLTTVNSIPYDQPGYNMIEQALMPTIQAGLNFGAFAPGVTLSQTQILAVNEATGVNAAPTLSAQGWYLQVQPASPTTREARQSPTILFYYCDPGSVQILNLTSILVQ